MAGCAPVADNEYECLPSKYEANERNIAAEFVEDLPAGSLSNGLARAIHGGSAFCPFKDTEIAIDWCDRQDIPYLP